MPIITPRNVAMSDGKFEVSVYRGTPDDAAEFGVSRIRDLDNNPTDIRHVVGNQTVPIGGYFRRTVEGWNGSAWTIVGAWLERGLETLRGSSSVFANVDQASAVLEQIDAITGEDGSRGSPQKAEGILVVDS